MMCSPPQILHEIPWNWNLGPPWREASD